MYDKRIEGIEGIEGIQSKIYYTSPKYNSQKMENEENVRKTVQELAQQKQNK